MAFPHNRQVAVGEEAYVFCPFNKQHHMTESSLQRHILRCMVNYPNYVSCPYNALHFFRNKEILEKHIPGCLSKPIAFDENDHQEELIHECADLRNARYWAEIVENWDK